MTLTDETAAVLGPLLQIADQVSAAAIVKLAHDHPEAARRFVQETTPEVIFAFGPLRARTLVTINGEALAIAEMSGADLPFGADAAIAEYLRHTLEGLPLDTQAHASELLRKGARLGLRVSAHPLEVVLTLHAGPDGGVELSRFGATATAH